MRKNIYKELNGMAIISITFVVIDGCNLLMIPGVTTILISYSSAFDNAAICLAYATEPLAVADDKSKPCEFPELKSEPLLIAVAGFIPSNPSWNPTKNCAKEEPTDNVPPLDASNPNTELEPTPAPTGIGFK